MIDERFVVLGAIISFVGVCSYLTDTIKGKIQPNKVTWLLCGLVPFIAFTAEVKQGVGLSALPVFMSGFNPFLVFLASFINKKARWNIGRLDVVCGILSVTGALLWYVTQVGNIAIVFSIFADGLALLPTLVKSYRNPETENYKAFFFAAISNVITLLAIRAWTFAYAGFPVYLLLGNFILFVMIRFKLGKLIENLNITPKRAT
jgi:hypothetical protein